MAVNPFDIADIAMWDSINYFTTDEMSLLDAACYNNADEVKKILSSGAVNPDKIPQKGKWSIFQFFVRLGHHDVAVELLKRSEKQHDLDVKGRTLLHLAALSGKSMTVKIVLLFKENKGGFALDAQDYDGNTALHYAKERGHADAAIMLITHGANPFIKNGLGLTPKQARQRAIENNIVFGA